MIFGPGCGLPIALREEAIPVIRLGLPRKIAEEFLATINLSVVISVEREEGVARVRRCPSDPDGFPIAGNIEKDAVLGGR